ncbi:MAG: sulfate/molybdate ABC transporter ATP-binding protein [Gammaproteobacteria bacterium]
MSIKVQGVRKSFGSFAALNDVSLDIPKGELTALLGPSGCGKTTLLRIIAGLELPDGGRILFDDVDTTHQHVRDRRVGFVFQHYALFRHMTVFENVAFGLRVRPRRNRPGEAAIHAKVKELLELVQLDWLADRYPPQLSGGQRQRIALARALAVEPRVLLLDEPFGALDARVRKELRRWLRRLHDELHVTSVFVTHDQEEALEVADRIVVMNAGAVEQFGTPDAVYEHPATPFVYQFLGDVNLFHSRIHAGRAKIGDFEFALDEHHDQHDTPALVYARPHELEVVREKNGLGGIAARIRDVRPIGAQVRLDLERNDGGGQIEAAMPREAWLVAGWREGEEVWVRPKRPRVYLEGETARTHPH